MKYEKPEVKMFKFDVEDIITTSIPFTTTTTTLITPQPSTQEDEFDREVL